MSSNSNIFLFGAAAVFGIVTAAGLFIVEHFTQNRRKHAMAKDLARLDRQVGCLQKELDQLREAQKQSGGKCKRRPASSASNLSSRSYDGDSSDLEFYDISDDDESELTASDGPEKMLEGIDDDLSASDAKRVAAAYDRLNRLYLEYPGNAEILTRLGRACYKLSLTAEDETVRDELLTKGARMCESALSRDPNAADAHKWLALIIGVRINSMSIQDKIEGSYLFKKHIDAAIAINSQDATLHHLLGRFTYEAANLKWYERKIAETLFSEPPSGTFDEALDHFLLADRLSTTDWKENKLMVGECLVALGRYREAVEALTLADHMSDTSDSQVVSRVRVLLQKYNGYR